MKLLFVKSYVLLADCLNCFDETSRFVAVLSLSSLL